MCSDVRLVCLPWRSAICVPQLEIYNARLDERKRKRDFILERGFLNTKKTIVAEKKRSAEEKEHTARLRVLARFQTQEQHDALLENLANETRLRQRLHELKARARVCRALFPPEKAEERPLLLLTPRPHRSPPGRCLVFSQELRAVGVKTLAEGEAYDADRRRRQADKARQRALENSAVGPGSGAAKSNVRANRYLSRDGPSGLTSSLLPPPGVPAPRELAGLRTNDTLRGAQQGAGAAGAAAKGKGGAKPLSGWMDVSSLPGAELLLSRERELCSQQRLVPLHFLAVKEGLLRASLLQGSVSRERALALFPMDPARLARVFELLLGARPRPG